MNCTRLVTPNLAGTRHLRLAGIDRVLRIAECGQQNVRRHQAIDLANALVDFPTPHGSEVPARTLCTPGNADVRKYSTRHDSHRSEARCSNPPWRLTLHRAKNLEFRGLFMPDTFLQDSCVRIPASNHEANPRPRAQSAHRAGAAGEYVACWFLFDSGQTMSKFFRRQSVGERGWQELLSREQSTLA